MHGLHLTADLHDCACESRWLTDADALLAACELRVRDVGLRPVARLAHRFAPALDASGGQHAGPGGVTATVLLAESHLCVHTWPELRAVTLDVYVCNFGGDHSAKAQALMQALLVLFAPGRTDRHAITRGEAA